MQRNFNCLGQRGISFPPQFIYLSLLCFFSSPSFLPCNNKIVWTLCYGGLLKWLEEPVNLVGTFGSRFSGPAALSIFHACMCTCLRDCVCACSRVMAAPVSLRVTQMGLDLVRACVETFPLLSISWSR